MIQHMVPVGSIGSEALSLPFDDAFITWRYVERAATGHGLTWNDGEAVFGISTPLYALVLLVVRLLSAPMDISLPVLGLAVNGVLSVVAAGLLWRLLRQWWPGRPGWAWATALLWLVDPGEIGVSLGGMETNLVLALWALVLQRQVLTRPILAGVLGGLACLARPESLVLVGPLVLHAIGICTPHIGMGVGGRLRLALPTLARNAMGSILAVAPWFAFALMNYGDLVPHSIRAKGAPLYDLAPGRALQDALFASGLPRPGGAWLGRVAANAGVGGQMAISLQYGLSLLLLLALATVLIRWQQSIFSQSKTVPEGRASVVAPHDHGQWASGLRVRPEALSSPLLALVLLLALYLLGNPFLLPWYLPPLRWLTRLAMLGCALALADRALHDVGAMRWRRVLALTLLFATGGWLANSAGVAWTLRRLPTPAAYDAIVRDPTRQRIRAYSTAARWLTNHAEQDARVMASEIGQLGWSWPGHIIDSCALVSAESLPFLPIPTDESTSPETPGIPKAAIERLRPDFIVSLPVFTRQSVDADPTLRSNYQEVARVPLVSPLWGDEALRILRRRSER